LSHLNIIVSRSPI